MIKPGFLQPPTLPPKRDRLPPKLNLRFTPIFKWGDGNLHDIKKPAFSRLFLVIIAFRIVCMQKLVRYVTVGFTEEILVDSNNIGILM
jgi:hypothetical protein